MATGIGVKDARSACARWSEVKKKLSLGGKLTPATAGEPSAPKARTPRKPKDPNATAKSTKRTPKSVAAAKEDDVEDPADEPASPTPGDAEMNEEGKNDPHDLARFECMIITCLFTTDFVLNRNSSYTNHSQGRRDSGSNLNWQEACP